MKSKKFAKDDAVSPVVGVMLMLVVTIIIAAVVSAFAGGIGSTTPKAPTLAMDVTLKNTGSAASSYIFFDVQSVSEQIPTKDLKIVTSWTAQNGTVSGGNVTTAGKNFPNTAIGSTTDKTYQSPLGFGKGVTVVGSPGQLRQNTSTPYDYGQYFGNYTLMPGTTMKNSPYYSSAIRGYGSGTPFVYVDRPADVTVDGMEAILGMNWNATRPGDVVNVKVIHLASGKVIFDKDVVVQG